MVFKMSPILISWCSASKKMANPSSSLLGSLSCWGLFLLLCLVLSHTDLALATGSKVQHLPGFQGPLPFELETGYVGVGEPEEVQLFYYFAKSQSSNPSKDPLIIWINGGPGCSSLHGLFFEIGPITFKDSQEFKNDLPMLVLNPHSWTQVANIIFLDLPVGTGFSYATTPKAHRVTDLESRDQAYEFLRKFLTDHPEYATSEFYMAGDSFSGLIVPLIAKAISDGNENGMKPSVNLKGYLVGNPVTRSPAESSFVVPFAHRIGLISDELHEAVQKNCKGDDYLSTALPGTPCYSNMADFNKTVENIEYPNILEPHCPYPDAVMLDMYNRGGQESMGDNLIEMNRHRSTFRFRCDGWRLLAYWCNLDIIREALRIRKGTNGHWVRCSQTLEYDVKVRNTVAYHEYLSSKGYRSLIYSGDHDMYVPYTATEFWIKSLNFNIVDEWRPWNYDGQVAGYTRSYENNMTFATVKGGGHTSPEYKPKECNAMFRRWINRERL